MGRRDASKEKTFEESGFRQAAELFSHTTECFRCKLERTPPRLERGWMSVSAFCRPLPPKGNDGTRTGGKDAD